MAGPLSVLTSLKSLFSVRAPVHAPLEFVCNTEEYRLDRTKLVDAQLGPPRATEWYTKERLVDEGYCGVYKTGPNFKMG